MIRIDQLRKQTSWKEQPCGEELEAMSWSTLVVKKSWQEWRELASTSGWMFEPLETGTVSLVQQSSSAIDQMWASVSRVMENREGWCATS